MLTDAYTQARGKGEGNYRGWEKDEPSAAQLGLLRRYGVTPPPGATKGECSCAISAVKAGQAPVGEGRNVP